MNKVKLFLMDLFFPNRCPVCNNIIVYDSIICDRCRDKLDVSKTEQEIICNIQDDVFYSYVLPGYYYENEARRGVLSLKDGNKNFGYYLGHILAARIMEQENLRNADYIVPIPMSK